MPLRLRISLLCLGIGLTAAAGVPSAQEASALEMLLSRAGDYAHEFVAQFSNVVADERYLQTWRGFRRQLTSQFLLIQPQDSSSFFAFRDVSTADGRPVRNGDDRLMKLLLEPSGSALTQAREISQEGARYTFGGVFNSPVVVIAFLQHGYQSRFRFSLVGTDRQVGQGVVVVEFTEQAHPTVVRGLGDSDMPASGRAWIETETGRIVKTELTFPNDSVVTTFRYDDRFKIDVPVEMTDRYRYMNNLVNGTATYGRFRRFGVSTTQSIGTEQSPDTNQK